MSDGIWRTKAGENPFLQGFGSKKSPSKRDGNRAFNQTQKKEILFQQNNKCARCHGSLDPRDIEFDHKKPWAANGRTITQNGRALHGSCHNIVTHQTRLKKVDRKRKPKPRTSNPFELKVPDLKLGF